MSRTTRLVLALVAIFALAACTQQEAEISTQEQVPAAARTEEPGAAGEGDGEGDGEEPAVEGTPSTWVAVDVDFAEFDAELPAGPVTVILDNTGANLPHNVVIEELGSTPVAEAEGGGTDQGTVELEPGEYTFFCSIPGHRGTMEETVTVS